MEKFDGKTKRLLEFIACKKSDRILVVGTGVYPKIEEILSKKFGCNNITSGDIDRTNVKKGKKLLPELAFLVLDAQEEFPFKAESFDKIIFTDVLEHLSNERIALQEISRVLARDGRLILSVPKWRWFNLFSPITLIQHKREYNEKGLTFLLKSRGLKVKKMFVALTEDLHRSINIHAVQQGITLRSFVIAAIEKALSEAKQ